MTAQLLKILGKLDARGIPAIPFKGPALAEAAYGDVAMRQFADLDVLVREKDVRAVKELLVAEGFEAARAMTDRQERSHLRRTCELSFSRPGSGIVLDVHWRFAADYMAPAADSRGAFDRHVVGRLQGCPVRALAPDDLLLFLCLHGTFHLWDALGQVSDVARFIESRDGWDWPRLRERAEKFRLSRMLLLGASLARELLGAETLTAAAGAEQFAQAHVARARHQIWMGQAGQSGTPGTQISAPNSIRAWLRCEQGRRNLGRAALLTNSSAMFQSCLRIETSRTLPPMPNTRVSTRMTLPSRMGVGWSKAMLQIAPAVYRPMPGSSSSVSNFQGTSPS